MGAERFALIFVLLALAMFGFYNLQLPSAWQAKLTEVSNRQSGGNLVGAAIMGFLSAIIVGPCVTAPLIGILIFISQTGDAVLGGSVLFALSIGMGLPLLAIGVGLGHWLPRAGGWMESVKAVFGVGLLALAIWMLERILPGGVTMLLWGALAISSGVYLGGLTRLDTGAGGWQKLWQALGVMLLVLGIMQFVGAAAGGKDWLRPLQPFSGGGGPAAQAMAQPEFTEVDDLEQLTRAMEAARPAGIPGLLRRLVRGLQAHGAQHFPRPGRGPENGRIRPAQDRHDRFLRSTPAGAQRIRPPRPAGLPVLQRRR